jgi:hypothetical protein
MNLLLADTAIISSDSGGDLVHQLIFLIVIGIVLGIIYWCVQNAPFMNAMFKQILGYVIIVVGVIVLINFLLGIAGHPLYHY